MTLPPATGPAATVAIALLIGFGFGLVLERAGLGSARKLAAQFTLADLTVFKVMFSAIVTAMLGLFYLGRLGVVDVARVYIPETHLLPQLAGGLLFGAGLAIAGLCPGTACVSAATGRLDGIAAMLGIFGGVLAASLAVTRWLALYESTPRGALTLPSLLHVPTGVVVAAVVAVALLGFRGATWIEERQ